MSVVPDSWAILSYLEDTEPTSSAVAELLDRTRPLVSWINLGEVFYVLCRRVGEDAASDVLRDLRRRLTAEVPGVERVLRAARIKAAYPMPYADAFAAATAAANRATLWTGDPELLVDGAPWTWRDLR